MPTYHLQVYGYLWSGPTAVYSYTVPADKVEKLLNAHEADCQTKACAGDFAALLDWRLVREDVAYERTASPPILRRIDTYRTLRGFRNGMRPSRFYRLANDRR
jgi:hypothetical protein